MFLAETAIAGELIHVKGSITDHLERIMLSQFDGVVCWQERCARITACLDCRNYRRPHPPPFKAAAKRASKAPRLRSIEAEEAMRSP
jgi:hypothetical protein